MAGHDECSLKRFTGALKAVLGGLALIVSGCAQPPIEPLPLCDFNALRSSQQGGPPPAGPVLIAPVPGTMADMPLNAVNITDVAITNKVMVQANSARRLNTGQVEVFARLVNCTDFALQLEGRTHFLDDVQRPVEGTTAWKRVFLPPRTVGNYDEVSVSTDSVGTYFIEIREGT